jgi:hypothetical protein
MIALGLPAPGAADRQTDVLGTPIKYVNSTNVMERSPTSGTQPYSAASSSDTLTAPQFPKR